MIRKNKAQGASKAQGSRRKAERGVSGKSSLEKYLAEPENSKEIEAGLEDVKAGRITYIDPENIWESIK